MVYIDIFISKSYFSHMEIKIFDNCPLSNLHYSGTERKRAILMDGVPFMLKFKKDTQFGSTFNHVSEYLGSHIYALLGFNAQETYLGTCFGEEVVACRDFRTNGAMFVPFNDVGESTIEESKDKYHYSYEDIVEMLRKNKKLTNVDETVSIFFEMYVVDALIGNFDRHGGNWGFLKKGKAYALAPIFDNGSCLFPQMIDENKMREVIDSEDETAERIYRFPTSQIKLNGKKSSYFDVISSLSYEGINEALKKIVPLVDLNKIFALIDGTPFITDIHKEFYRHMLKERYERILLHSYKLLRQKEAE